MIIFKWLHWHWKQLWFMDRFVILFIALPFIGLMSVYFYRNWP